jgi:hypothetical protein
MIESARRAYVHRRFFDGASRAPRGRRERCVLLTPEELSSITTSVLNNVGL